jgi:hypothetical protein
MVLEYIDWNLRDDPRKAKRADKLLTESDWNQSFPMISVKQKSGNFKLTILVPVTRYEENFQTIHLLSKAGTYTCKEILWAIYLFYHQNISLTDLKFSQETDDIWGYLKAANKNLKQGKSVKWIALLGDNIFFEGLKFNKASRNWILNLGS